MFCFGDSKNYGNSALVLGATQPRSILDRILTPSQLERRK